MSRLTGITYPDNSTVGFTYDSRGRRITATDQNNKMTTYTYDDADCLTEAPMRHTTTRSTPTTRKTTCCQITDANNHINAVVLSATIDLCIKNAIV